MKKTILAGFVLMFAVLVEALAGAADNLHPDALDDLKNYQVNTPTMLSAGLPDEEHFKALKSLGVKTVIDLIPGNRTEERQITGSLDLNYFNIEVVWGNPTLQNFKDYVAAMQTSREDGGITLTHCKLNWRGAVFTYLYRVTQLQESEEAAKRDMLEIWRPNETWQAFIDEVKAHYQSA